MRLPLATGLLLAALPCAAAGPIDAAGLCALVAAQEAEAKLPAPDPARLAQSPTRDRQLPLFREVMAQPALAPCRAAELAQSAAAAADSPAAAWRWLASLAGVAVRPEAPLSPPRISAVDPLAASLDWLQPFAAASGRPWPPPLPSPAELPEPLRRELGMLLGAVGSAQLQLAAALRRLPAGVDAADLRAQAMQGAAPAAHAVLDLLPLVDRGLLADAALDLAAAVERFGRFVAVSPLPRLDWQLDTPLGAVIVDTTGRDSDRTLAAPLLLVDVGGDDRYTFTTAQRAGRVSVLFDHGGNDRYVAAADGADPSAATLGIGILWDSGGDDTYEGRDLAQAAAVLGAALLVDTGGANRFAAVGHAQGYAFGGLALLLAGGSGDDIYGAATHAQASAGPEGVAALIDAGGNDTYTLGNTPLARPSPQLPERNTSMGQGAGRGWRPNAANPRGAAGGIGVLVDLGGDDRYVAQVFAQGAGYHEGLGVLVDAGGADRFDAAWYALGAAAHTAAGVLLEAGGDDRYRATHSTSLGAAHDDSVAAFVDAAGDDDYALGDLGLGAAHDGGTALFLDGGGRNSYRVDAADCRAFGVAQGDGAGASVDGAGSGVFVDRGCAATPSPRCARTCAAAR